MRNIKTAELIFFGCALVITMWLLLRAPGFGANPSTGVTQPVQNQPGVRDPVIELQAEVNKLQTQVKELQSQVYAIQHPGPGNAGGVNPPVCQPGIRWGDLKKTLQEKSDTSYGANVVCFAR